MDTSDSKGPGGRRSFLRHISIVPAAVVAVVGMSGCSDRVSVPGTTEPYQPAFFGPAEWRFVVAAVDRLIPADDIGPGALETGVPEFMDRHMQTPYASGDIWYMQGPFLDASPEFGYQGRLPVRDILRVGIQAFDALCLRSSDGKTFAELDRQRQEALLKDAESGRLKLEGISARLFFGQLLAETRMGYFCDPKHGGNKDMRAWKMIGYPGMRADYADWVEVRDKPYPLPPVDLAGRRG